MLNKKVLLTLIFVVIIGIINNYGVVYADGELKVHFIDVGQGDCILIQSPDGKTMLIDGGPTDAADKVETYLKDNNITKIDILVGTQPRQEHIGGLITVVNDFDIGSIYMPETSSNTNTFKALQSAINNKGLIINSPEPEEKISFASDIEATVLAPNDSGYVNLYNYSIVIKLVYGKTAFLFTGDAEKDSEDEMLAKGYDLRADVLKVGNHGSISSTSKKFLTAVAPKYAIISVSANTNYYHPQKGTLKRLEDACVTVYSTDRDGTIIVSSDGTKISINTEK